MQEKRSAYEVTNFIEEKTTIREFYNFVTFNGTNFNYDINDVGRSDVTALHAACLKGNFILIEALLNVGANVHCQLNNGSTPLYLAIDAERLDIIQLLLAHGASLDDALAKETEKNAYIEYAMEKGNKLIADYLIVALSKNPKELLINKLKFYPENKQAIIAEYEEKTGELCDEAAIAPQVEEKNARPQFGYYAEIDKKLGKAIREKNIEEVKSVLVQHKGAISLDASLTYSAAILHNNKELLELLIANGGYITDSYSGLDRFPIIRDFVKEAREVGNKEIADYLEKVQSGRYQRLLELAERQEKQTLFILGTFFDKGSNLSKELGAETKEIVRSILSNG